MEPSVTGLFPNRRVRQVALAACALGGAAVLADSFLSPATPPSHSQGMTPQLMRQAIYNLKNDLNDKNQKIEELTEKSKFYQEEYQGANEALRDLRESNAKLKLRIATMIEQQRALVQTSIKKPLVMRAATRAARQIMLLAMPRLFIARGGYRARRSAGQRKRLLAR